MTTILHSIDTGGPGGAETIFTTLASQQTPGVRHVALAKPGDWVERTLRELDVECHFVGTKGSFNTDYLKKIRELIREYRVDIVQSHLYGSNLYCAIAGRLSGTPVVATFHGARDLAAPGFANRLKRTLVQRGASALIAVSHRLRDELLDAGFADESKLSVVHNGIDIQRFSATEKGIARAQYGIAPDAPLIGAIGNVRQPKGYEVLVEAFSTVHAALPNARLIIVGEGSGSLLADLQSQIEASHLQQAIHLAGFVPNPESILADLDVYCSSSHSEGFSLTCVEAMAAGAPVVATRSGGPEEILTDRETGLLVPTGDPDALATALLETLQNPQAAEQRAHRAFQRAESHFSVNSMVRGYYAVHEKLLGRAISG